MKHLCELKKIFKRIYEFESLLKKNVDISINEALSLCSLAEGKINPNIIAKEIGISQGRMSRILSSLEKKNLIARAIDKEDKRVMNFSLTAEGVKKLDDLRNCKVECPDFSDLM